MSGSAPPPAVCGIGDARRRRRGGVALPLRALARDGGGPLPSRQLLIYPWCDLSAKRRSHELFGEGYRARVVAGAGTQRSLHCWRDGRLEVEELAYEGETVDLRNGSYREVVEFVRALREGGRPKPEIDDVLPSLRAVFSIAKSAMKLNRQDAKNAKAKNH